MENETDQSDFPWSISMCTGDALQFMILDAKGAIVLMAELYSITDLLSILTLFQRNPEIKVDPKLFQDAVERRKALESNYKGEKRS